MSTPKGRTRSNKAKPIKSSTTNASPESNGHNESVAEYRDVEDLDLTPTFQEALDEISRQHAEAVETTKATFQEAMSDLDSEGNSDDDTE